jgi:hypothetical protein
LFADDDHLPVCTFMYTDGRQLAVQRDRITRAPFHGCMTFGDTQALGGDPLLMPPEKSLGVAAGTAAGNRDPQRTVRPYSKDVFARAADAHEVHVRLRRWLRRAEEREVELHPLRIQPDASGFQVSACLAVARSARRRTRRRTKGAHSFRIAISGSTAIARRAGM